MTVNSILTATKMLLTEKGLGKITTNKIVEKAGVSIGSLYQYFPNKNAILSVVVEKIFKSDVDEVVAKLDEIGPDSHSLQEAISEILELIFGSYVQKPKLNKEIILSTMTLKSIAFTLKHDGIVKKHLLEFLNKYHDQIRENVDLERFIFTFHYAIKGLKFGITYNDKTSYADGIASDLTTMIYSFLKKG
ncbi:MAG: TetR/AcrR family transcriptional regulator [Bacteriovoracaceae bacterium]|nr:TetR/AcrR family transcriptional regulator [Bacteriovoracaceae bacterium]